MAVEHGRRADPGGRPRRRPRAARHERGARALLHGRRVARRRARAPRGPARALRALLPAESLPQRRARRRVHGRAGARGRDAGARRARRRGAAGLGEAGRGAQGLQAARGGHARARFRLHVPQARARGRVRQVLRAADGRQARQGRVQVRAAQGGAPRAARRVLPHARDGGLRQRPLLRVEPRRRGGVFLRAVRARNERGPARGARAPAQAQEAERRGPRRLRRGLHLRDARFPGAFLFLVFFRRGARRLGMALGTVVKPGWGTVIGGAFGDLLGILLL